MGSGKFQFINIEEVKGGDFIYAGLRSVDSVNGTNRYGNLWRGRIMI